MKLPYNSFTQGPGPTDLRARGDKQVTPTLPHPYSPCISVNTRTPSHSCLRGQSPGWSSQEGFLEEGNCGLLVYLLHLTRDDQVPTSSRSCEVGLDETLSKPGVSPHSTHC